MTKMWNGSVSGAFKNLHLTFVPSDLLDMWMVSTLRFWFWRRAKAFTRVESLSNMSFCHCLLHTKCSTFFFKKENTALQPFPTMGNGYKWSTICVALCFSLTSSAKMLPLLRAASSVWVCGASGTRHPACDKTEIKKMLHVSL